MKYLKEYNEYQIPKYKIGDYVQIDNGSGPDDGLSAKIINIDDTRGTIYYEVRFVDSPDQVYPVMETEINRRLEDYEIEAFKYNL